MTFLQLQSNLFHCSWVGMNLFFPGRLYLATKFSHLKDNTSYLFTSYDSLDVLHAAVTNFNFISVEYLIKDVGFWEMGTY